MVHRFIKDHCAYPPLRKRSATVERLIFAILALAAAAFGSARPGHAQTLDEVPAFPQRAITIAGTQVQPGTLARLELKTSESYSGSWLPTPIVVAHGRNPGPRLCVVAGVHGDEVNGVEVVRRLVRGLDPDALTGTVVAVPIANVSAFSRGSRYLPDRRDLNRYFPGDAHGSAASRIAFGLFQNVLRGCEFVIDLHTGSFHRSNLHQLRAHLGDPATADLSYAFGAEVIVNSPGLTGTLRRAATDYGIPAITIEAGESTRFDDEQAEEALSGILRLMHAKEMISEGSRKRPKNPTAYLETTWIRCDQGGILVSDIELGASVVKGQKLGTISDPLSDEVVPVTSRIAGRLIGKALDQVVMPGFAAFHIAYEPQPIGRDETPVVLPPSVATRSAEETVDLEERPE